MSRDEDENAAVRTESTYKIHLVFVHVSDLLESLKSSVNCFYLLKTFEDKPFRGMNPIITRSRFVSYFFAFII